MLKIAQAGVVPFAVTMESRLKSATGSLEEGLDEKLRVIRLASSRFERVLSMTNAIENLIGSVRDLGRRVSKRWPDDANDRPLGPSLRLLTPRCFRLIADARGAMSNREIALRAHDAATNGALASRTRVA